jgi:hypothetical protein
MPIIPATWEMEKGGSWFKAIPGQKKNSYHDPVSQNKPDVTAHSYNPSYSGSISRSITVQGQPRQQSTELLSEKITKAERAECMVQMGRALA